MKKTYLIIITVLLSVGFAKAQSCNDQLPEGVWSGLTIGSGGDNGEDDVSITKVNNTFVISDISAGLIDQIQATSEDFSLGITLNCDGSVQAVSKTTIFGPLKITSGQWDPVNQTLTYQWSVEVSAIFESTTLTFTE